MSWACSYITFSTPPTTGGPAKCKMAIFFLTPKNVPPCILKGLIGNSTGNGSSVPYASNEVYYQRLPMMNTVGALACENRNILDD
jgi:hypothetical protein